MEIESCKKEEKHSENEDDNEDKTKDKNGNVLEEGKSSEICSFILANAEELLSFSQKELEDDE